MIMAPLYGTMASPHSSCITLYYARYIAPLAAVNRDGLPCPSLR